MKKQIKYERYGNYILNRGDSLGSGTFGKVYKGYRILSQNSFGNYERLRLQPVAIKQSYCQASNYQQISILKILKHPNIIRYIDYKIHGNNLFMIMELCEQGTMEDLLMDLPEDDNLFDILTLYYAQVISGIKFMYEKNILHRDIKPSNILIKDNTVKIADFGTSKLKQDKQLRTLVGTPLFSSPELLEISLPSEQSEGTELKSFYTQKSDIWSLGLVLYMMFNYQKNHQKQGDRLRNSLPWSGNHAGLVLKNILTQPLAFKKQNIPENIKQIIQKMLKIDPSERMSFKQLFALQQFQEQSMHHLKINLSESNLAVSRSFVPQNSMLQDQFCLTHAKDQQSYVAQQIQKKQIDWQLLKLLQIKDSQHYQDDQIKQAIQFYTFLLSQLNQIYQPKQDQQLLYLIDKKIYQLHRWRLWNIEEQMKQVISQSMLKIANNGKQQNKQPNNNTLMQIDKESISQILSQIKNRYKQTPKKCTELENIVDETKFLKLIEKPEIQELISKQKIIINFIKPSEMLVKKMKIYVKRNFREELVGKFLNNKIKCNMNITKEYIKQKHKIYFIYDLFTFIQFQYSWKIKSQLSTSYIKKYNLSYNNKDSFLNTFKNIRNNVNIKQIINRIKESYNFLKIAAVQEVEN